MSSNGSLERLQPAAAPVRVGQATAVEQSRAVAEVQAAVIVAQQCPRSVTTAVQAMEEACAQPALAGRAFFRFERGKDARTGKPNIVTGPSVHLARELARCWGNLQHGITELARDDAHGESEMKAWAWDLQTNTTSSNTFIVPHKRDTRNGVRQLTDMRDIYENNANNGARRLREAIFSVLPTWYTEQAKELCQQTNEKGGGKPLATRIADAVKAFERYRVSPARMAAKFGYKTVDELTAHDVAQLAVIYSSLGEGAVTVDDEFPVETGGLVGEADIAPENPSPAGTEPPPPPSPSAAPLADAPPADEDPAAPARVRAIWACLHGDYEYASSEADTARAAVGVLAGRPLGSLNELGRDEAKRIFDQLRRWVDQARETGERPRDILAADIASRDADPREQDGTATGE